MRQLIAIIVCVSVFTACDRQQSKAQSERGSYQLAVHYILDNNDNHSSVVPWTHDSIKALYPELVMQIDPLYQFQPTDTLEKDLLFMSETRKRLCAFYDSADIWEKSDNEYAKVDSVINYANEIYSSRALAMADMMIATDIRYRIDRIRHYGLFQQLVGHRNAAYYHLQEAEWTAWDTLQKTMETIVCDLVDMSCLGGWYAGIVRLTSCSKIRDAHISLYERDLALYSSESYIVVGSYQKSAKQFLISCCQEAYDNVLNNDYIEADNWTKITKAISNLPVLIDNWLDARNAWTEEICSDGTRELFLFSTSQTLIDMGTVVSTY